MLWMGMLMDMMISKLFYNLIDIFTSLVANNKTYIKITDERTERELSAYLQKCCYLKIARKKGDKEMVNQTQLGRLKQYGIKFEIAIV